MLFIALDSLTYVIFHSLFKLIEDQGFPGGSVVKNLPANTGVTGYMRSIPLLGRSQKKEMAAYSSFLAWEITWTEEPGGLQSMVAELDMTEHAPIA